MRRLWKRILARQTVGGRGGRGTVAGWTSFMKCKNSHQVQFLHWQLSKFALFQFNRLLLVTKSWGSLLLMFHHRCKQQEKLCLETTHLNAGVGINVIQIYYIENNTWARGDMKCIFECLSGYQNTCVLTRHFSVATQIFSNREASRGTWTFEVRFERQSIFCFEKMQIEVCLFNFRNTLHQEIEPWVKYSKRLYLCQTLYVTLRANVLLNYGYFLLLYSRLLWILLTFIFATKFITFNLIMTLSKRRNVVAFLKFLTNMVLSFSLLSQCLYLV